MTTNPITGYLKPCASCHDLLPLTAYYPRKDTRDGRDYSCKCCVNAQHRETRKRQKKQAKELALASIPKVDPSALTPSRSFVNAVTREAYRPAADNVFYRNDGHKNIPSRGVRC